MKLKNISLLLMASLISVTAIAGHHPGSECDDEKVVDVRGTENSGKPKVEPKIMIIVVDGSNSVDGAKEGLLGEISSSDDNVDSGEKAVEPNDVKTLDVLKNIFKAVSHILFYDNSAEAAKHAPRVGGMISGDEKLTDL